MEDAPINTVDLLTCWIQAHPDSVVDILPLLEDAYLNEAASDNARML